MLISATTSEAHTVSRMEFSLGYGAHVQLNGNWNCRDVSAPFNRLYLVVSGSAKLWTETQQLEMVPGMAYLIPAGLHCSYACGGLLEKYYFHFNLYRPNRYDLLWGSEEIGVFPLKPGVMSKINDCLGSGGLLETLELQQSIMDILLAYLRQTGFSAGMSEPYSPDVADTLGYIRKNLSARLKVEDLAQRRFVSRTHLAESFRKETGVTLGRYIDDQLILEAQRRLCHTDASVGDISRDLGFSDQFYFSRRFSQLTGMNPLAYRREFR